MTKVKKVVKKKMGNKPRDIPKKVVVKAEPKKVVKKPVVKRTEPKKVLPKLKELPVVDGYQVVKVKKEGHTKTHLLCQAVSESGERVELHANKKLF